MIFFLFTDFVCSLRLILVISTLFVTISTLEVRVVPCYASSTLLLMTVTTRSQSKRLQNVNRVHSFSSTSGSSLSSTTSSILMECNNTTTTSVTVPPCNHSTATSSSLDLSLKNLDNHDLICHPCHLSSSSTSSTVSKFQNSKISNSSTFDPGITQCQSHTSFDKNNSNMEADYQDGENVAKASPKQDENPDLNAFLNVIKHHIENATDKMAGDFRQVIEANSTFKQEITNQNDSFKIQVKQELDELRQLILQQQPLSSGTSSHTSSFSSQPGISITSSTQPVPILNHVLPSPLNTPSPVISSSTTDQVLLLLTDSFTKMANALTEKSVDTKAEWPKFGGDGKKFKAWYLAIITQLSIAPWREFYDQIKNDVVTVTTNTTLNEKLYSKLILALEGTALQQVVSRKHLRANGLAVLQDLVQTYKPKNIPEVIAAKTSEFWGTLKRNPTESIDAYYNRFHDLLDDLEEADEKISDKSALRQFLFTLGPEFEPIQHNYRMNNLPEDWKTLDWPKFLALCRNYYNSVKPTLPDRKSSPSADASFDKEAHQKKIRDWFLNPTKFCKHIENEQLRHPNKCIYHLSKTHLTDKCAVILECDHLLAAKRGGTYTTAPTGQLRHITEELSSDSVLEDESVVDFDTTGNL